jgi:hypothetical protein
MRTTCERFTNFVHETLGILIEWLGQRNAAQLSSIRYIRPSIEDIRCYIRNTYNRSFRWKLPSLEEIYVSDHMSYHFQLWYPDIRTLLRGKVMEKEGENVRVIFLEPSP